MQTARYLYWGAQLGGWFTYAMLVSLATYEEHPEEIDGIFVISLFTFVFSGVLVTHIMRMFFLRWKWLSLRLAPLIPRILLVSVAGAAIVEVMNYAVDFAVTLLLRQKSPETFSWLQLVINILALVVLILMWNAIYFTYHFFRKSINQELYNLQLQSSQNEIELKNLRSQLNPHFLFNSLNSIRALIDIHPVKAKESITTLSNLLRNSLVVGKNAFISIGEELQIVRSYLELEKIRFEERLEICWEIDESLNDFQIPPFILQTQAENAIKHGISKIIAGGRITVRTRIVNHDTVLLSVENTGRLGRNMDTGIGIENSKRRLDLQYGGKARFDLFQQGGNVVCNIEIRK